MQLTQSLSIDDFFIVEGTLPFIIQSTGLGIYDFDFRNFFNVQSAFYSPNQPTIARIGAIEKYHQIYHELLAEEITLIHSPDEHERCSLLPVWYPLIADLTPYSMVYTNLPSAKTVEEDFEWPIFVKGERQTHKHKKSLSIIENAEQFEHLLIHWQYDPMLHWQKMVCRQYISLQVVENSVADRIPSSFEFRLFYWKQQLVSIGRYWYTSYYDLSDKDREQALKLADEVSKRILVCFLVIDVAKTVEGNWIVIEVNDGQESGFAGNNAFLLWQNIIKVEHRLQSI
ncbi:ATP-grasp domain-containing protein [Rhodocytophaga rosea]|uniref:ATP-grasp domain-containing protein n=1 Tax=Rhodocytophaga rosea TaxID=2704465 RepID=A0A6C0GD98_9BACT|nr:ATP-grasp domain-containing protein [Rhodocytophaga rosea]QHT65868.1 ATP-grasp domain-containing protein [Rhodocytophaga rosea]